MTTDVAVRTERQTEAAAAETDQQQQQQAKGTTFVRTCFNGVNTLAGIGIVSIPYAVSQSGWMSLCLLVVVAILCLYTGLLLKRCMDTDPLIKTYPDIGQVAFGKKGRIIISILMYIELYLDAIEYLILEGDNMHKLFPNAYVHVRGMKLGGKPGFVALATLVVLPTTWLRSLGMLAYVSAGGVLASLILVVSVFWVGAFDGVGFHERGTLWRWNGLSTSICMFTFSYCGHVVLPTLYNSMKDKSKFPKVLIVCFTLTTITYGAMAITGYLMFGDNVLSQVTLNLPTKKISSSIAIYTTLINPITKYAIVVCPLAQAVEDKYPLASRRPISLLLRSLIVISTAVVAIAIPYFAYVMAFIGAFLSVTVSLLIPCLCYLKINKAARAFGLELMLIMGILIMGFPVGIIGTITSVRDIITHVQPKS